MFHLTRQRAETAVNYYADIEQILCAQRCHCGLPVDAVLAGAGGEQRTAMQLLHFPSLSVVVEFDGGGTAHFETTDCMEVNQFGAGTGASAVGAEGEHCVHGLGWDLVLSDLRIQRGSGFKNQIAVGVTGDFG
jgi:hypothetical protein